MGELLRKVGKRIGQFASDFSIGNLISGFFDKMYKSLSYAEYEQKLAAERTDAEDIFKRAKQASFMGNELQTAIAIKELEAVINDAEQKNALQEAYPEFKRLNCYLKSVLRNGVDKASDVASKTGTCTPESLTEIIGHVCQEYGLRGRKLEQEKCQKLTYRIFVKNALKNLKKIAESGINTKVEDIVELLGSGAKQNLQYAGYSQEKATALAAEIDKQWAECYNQKLRLLERAVISGGIERMAAFEYWIRKANESFERRGLKTRYLIPPQLYMHAAQTACKREAYTALEKLVPGNNGNGKLNKRGLAKRFKEIKNMASRLEPDDFLLVQKRIRELKKEYGFWSEEKEPCWNGGSYVPQLKNRIYDKRIKNYARSGLK